MCARERGNEAGAVERGGCWGTEKGLAALLVLKGLCALHMWGSIFIHSVVFY